jgi:rhamnose transport system substrate-binding protein
MMLVSIGELIGCEGEFAIFSTPTATNQNAWIAFMTGRMTHDVAQRLLSHSEAGYLNFRIESSEGRTNLI